MKKDDDSESTIIVDPSKSVLVYALHSLEYVLGLARFRVFVPKKKKIKTVCYGVRGRALASHTGVRGFEPQCGGKLPSLTNLLTTVRKS